MNIHFIGGGNMAQAIIGGLLAKGHDAASITVTEPLAATRQRLEQEFKLKTFDGTPGDILETTITPALIVLAVKPQQMREVALSLAPQLCALTNKPVVLTIAAGIRLQDLQRWLGGHTQLARCMPNTPALIGAGISAVYAAPAVDAVQRDAIRAVLAAVGQVLWVGSENQLDPATAVSGSGPAYVFYFIEALQQAAIELGFESQSAQQLALETFLGAARLAARSTDPVSVLRERVTSKGGTTERALASLQASAVKQHIVDAVLAANARAIELGIQLGTDPTPGSTS
jgi:pyrroline-5-carboxylate reductase